MQSRVRVTMMRAMVMGGHKPGGMADTAAAVWRLLPQLICWYGRCC